MVSGFLSLVRNAKGVKDFFGAKESFPLQTVTWGERILYTFLIVLFLGARILSPCERRVTAHSALNFALMLSAVGA